jgi:hypothetical protein
MSMTELETRVAVFMIVSFPGKNEIDGADEIRQPALLRLATMLGRGSNAVQ